MADPSNSLSNGTVLCEPKWNALIYVVTAGDALIFVLSVLGNSLVVVTIIQSAQMRTVTNMFLLNLAISDLLLSVLCMPPTLLGLIYQCWLFGEVVCYFMVFLQPTSVTACSFTLVVIAVERYIAICRPLHSRRWQTKRHAAKMISMVWILSFIFNAPFLALATHMKYLHADGTYKYNCITTYPSSNINLEQLHMLCMLVVLFVGPLIMMIVLYSAVINSLWTGIKRERYTISQRQGHQQQVDCYYQLPEASQAEHNGNVEKAHVRKFTLPKLSGVRVRRKTQSLLSDKPVVPPIDDTSLRRKRVSSPDCLDDVVLRSTHSEKNLVSKRRVINMLAAIVIEFFVCWIPFYVLLLSFTFNVLEYNQLTSTVHSLTLLLAYASSCTNPITYCFMNSRFRKAFWQAFQCSPRSKTGFLAISNNGGTLLTITPSSNPSARPTPRCSPSHGDHGEIGNGSAVLNRFACLNKSVQLDVPKPTRVGSTSTLDDYSRQSIVCN